MSASTIPCARCGERASMQLLGGRCGTCGLPIETMLTTDLDYAPLPQPICEACARTVPGGHAQHEDMVRCPNPHHLLLALEPLEVRGLIPVPHGLREDVAALQTQEAER